MKFDLGQTMQTLANFGVLAGIVFLAIEIRQNHTVIEEQNTLNRLSGRFAALEGYSGMRTFLLENPDLLRISDAAAAGEELTAFEARQFRLMCQNRVWLQVSLYAQDRAFGGSGEDIVTVARLDNGRSTYSRECWEDVKGGVSANGYDDFVGQVDSDQ